MGAKYPKTVAKIVDDADLLLEFYRYGRTLGAPSHHETDRKCLCHSTFETQGDKRGQDRALPDWRWPTT